MAIGHRVGDKAVIDATREMRPPFSPEAVIDEFAALLKAYRITKVHGDRYAGEFPRELFRKRGVSYVCSQKAKSDLFRDLLPLLNSGRIVLPKIERLTNQLCGLERRVSRSGKDSIDHGPGQHDDLANAVAGVADLIIVNRNVQPTFGIYGGPAGDTGDGYHVATRFAAVQGNEDRPSYLADWLAANRRPSSPPTSSISNHKRWV